MKKIVLYLSLITLLGGCSVMRPPQPSVRDSTRVEVVERIERVTDTVFIEIPADHREQTVCDTISRLETEWALSVAHIKADGGLFHSLENKPQRHPERVVTEVVVRDSIIFRDRVVERSAEKMESRGERVLEIMRTVLAVSAILLIFVVVVRN